MSLLWKVAARSGWWDARQRGDLTEMNRHKDMAAKAHGVPGFRAGSALRPVYQALSRSWHGEMKPTEAGFASGPKNDEYGDTEMPWSDDHSLNEHENWHHVPVSSVSLRQPVHATQDGVSARMVVHNLFHPGKLPPVSYAGSESEHEVGNPHTDPDSYPREERERQTNPDEASKVPRFYRDKNFKLHVADGHHQVAAALLLGKDSIPGRVWDERNPPEGVR